METLARLPLLFLFVFGVAYAGNEVKIENGEILVSPSVWTATGVRVTGEAQKYPSAVSEVFRNPGKTIVVEKKMSYAIVDLFHYRKDTTATLGVRYDATEAIVDVQPMENILETGVLFFPYLIFWLIAMVAVYVSGRVNICIPLFAVAAFAAAVAAALAAATVAATVAVAAAAFVATAVAAFVALAAALVVEGDKRVYKVSSTVFYVLMVLLAGLVYSPLFL